MPACPDIVQVEAGMAESIKESCKLGVAAYAAQAREQWVLEWPGQVVLAVSAIFWTSAVTNALKNGIPGRSCIILQAILKAGINAVGPAVHEPGMSADVV